MTAGPGFLVLAGPSGAGKTTIASGLVERWPERFAVSVSVTTRPARRGERGGVEYRFVSRREFGAMIEAGELAEWAEVHGECYGTPLRNLSGEELDSDAGRGRGVGRGGRAASPAGPGIAAPPVVLVLDIDVQGARQVVRRSPEAVVMFVVPPGPGPWLRRLRGRGTESPRQIAGRLATALRELEAAESLARAPQFGGFVVNESVDGAVCEVVAAVDGFGRAGPAVGRARGRAGVRALCLRLAEGARAEIERLERAGGDGEAVRVRPQDGSEAVPATGRGT